MGRRDNADPDRYRQHAELGLGPAGEPRVLINRASCDVRARPFNAKPQAHQVERRRPGDA